MKLLKHANVYTPAPLGKRDVLIEGERILRIAEEITGYDELPDVDVYDLSGKTLVPAYIDLHVLPVAARLCLEAEEHIIQAPLL